MTLLYPEAQAAKSMIAWLKFVLFKNKYEARRV